MKLGKVWAVSQTNSIRAARVGLRAPQDGQWQPEIAPIATETQTI